MGMGAAMTHRLGTLFAQFQKTDLPQGRHAKTRIWYETAWRAFGASQSAPPMPDLSDSVEPLYRPSWSICVTAGIRPRSVNTYLQALNASPDQMHEEGHQPEFVRVGL
jgi:hypothetical protein